MPLSELTKMLCLRFLLSQLSPKDMTDDCLSKNPSVFPCRPYYAICTYHAWRHFADPVSSGSWWTPRSAVILLPHSLSIVAPVASLAAFPGLVTAPGKPFPKPRGSQLLHQCLARMPTLPEAHLLPSSALPSIPHSLLRPPRDAPGASSERAGQEQAELRAFARLVLAKWAFLSCFREPAGYRARTTTGSQKMSPQLSEEGAELRNKADEPPQRSPVS